MFNNVVLTGRLTKDPELKYSSSGVAMVNFTLAVQRSFQNHNGERDSDFIVCKAFKKTAELIANHFTKGSLLGVEGRIQTGNYEGQDGKRVYTTDVMVNQIHFLEKKQDNGQQQGNTYQGGTYGGQPQQQYGAQPQQQYGQQQQPQQGYGGTQQGYGFHSQQQPQQGVYHTGNGTTTNNWNEARNDDPFANSKGPINVPEDDLPF